MVLKTCTSNKQTPRSPVGPVKTKKASQAAKKSAKQARMAQGMEESASLKRNSRRQNKVMTAEPGSVYEEELKMEKAVRLKPQLDSTGTHHSFLLDDLPTHPSLALRKRKAHNLRDDGKCKYFLFLSLRSLTCLREPGAFLGQKRVQGIYSHLQETSLE